MTDWNGVVQVGLYFSPAILLLGAALVVFLLDVLGVKRRLTLGLVTLVGSVGALLLVLADLGWEPLLAIRTIPASMIDVPVAPSDLWAFSSLGLIFQAIFLTAALLVLLASLSRPAEEKGAAIFFGLLTLATLGMLLAASAANLFFLLLALEVTAISSYLLVGYTRRDPRHLEAAMKFYIIGALSTALSFFGASLLFGAFGSLSFVVLSQATAPVTYPSLAWLGYAFLIAGVGFKVTAVPFHAWAVDVYDGAPHDVSAFLAGGTKKVGLLAFFLIFIGPLTILKFHPVECLPTCVIPYNFAPGLALTLGILAVLTMTVGNVLALMQKEMKRMLAYSSISQAGYMLIGVAIGTSAAVTGATFQVFAHVFMKTGAFLVVGAVAALGVGPLIQDWKGVGVRRPYLGLAFALMLLSLAGIPLTVGFVSKFVLFSAAVQAQGLYVWLAVAGVLNSALSVYYYARVLKVMYIDRPEPMLETGLTPATGSVSAALARIGYGRAAAIGVATAAIVVFGVDPQLVLGPLQSAAAHFVATGA